MSRLLPAVLGLVGLMFAAPALSAPPFLVAEHGEPVKFRYAGVQSFTAEEIASALETDIEFLLAAHPQASFPPLLRVLQEKLGRGYQHSGFPHAKVAASWDEVANQIVVQVTEGTRYRAGGVKVLGANKSSREKLAAWITASTLPKKDESKESKEAGDKKKKDDDKRQWKAGEPVTFVPWTWKKFEARVTSGLAAQGFHFPRFKVEVSAEGEAGLATLVVHLEDEGPSGVIGEIKVTGSERYTAAEIERYLGLKTPLAFDAELEDRINEQLRASARFLFHRVTITPPAEEQGRMTLAIQLRDNLPSVPPLGAELSREEQVMLRMANWFEHGFADEADLVVGLSGTYLMKQLDMDCPGIASLVFSARKGAMLHSRLRFGDGPPLEHQLICSTDELSFNSLARGTYLQMPGLGTVNNNQTGILVNFHIHGIETPRDDGKQTQLNFGFGITHDPAGNVPPIRVALKYDPAVALCDLHRGNRKIDFDGPLMRLSDPSSVIEIEHATGRLVRFELRNTEDESALSISAVPGAFDSRLREAAARRENLTNGWNAELPLTSVTQYLLDEYQHVCAAQLPEERRHQLALVRQLLVRVCRRGDQWLSTAPWDKKQESFSLAPPEKADSQGWQPIVAGGLLKGAKVAFPRESPPWTISRESAFMLGGKATYAQRELNGLLTSPSTGPISGLYAAGLFKYINADVSRRFAHTSLARTDVRFLRRDLQWLLSPDCLACVPLVDVGEALRELKPDEVRALAAMIPAEEHERESIAAALLVPQADRDRPIADALPATLEAFWDAWLKQQIERWLKVLSEQGLPKTAVSAVGPPDQGTSRIPTKAGG